MTSAIILCKPSRRHCGQRWMRQWSIWWTSVRELAAQAAATPPRPPHCAVVRPLWGLRPLFTVIDQWRGCGVTLLVTKRFCSIDKFNKQGVALTGRNRTGPPCSVGRPTAHAPGGRSARPPAALQTTTDDDDKQQTTEASEQNNTGPLGGPVLIGFVNSNSINHMYWNVSISSRFLYERTSHIIFLRFYIIMRFLFWWKCPLFAICYKNW